MLRLKPTEMKTSEFIDKIISNQEISDLKKKCKELEKELLNIKFEISSNILIGLIFFTKKMKVC